MKKAFDQNVSRARPRLRVGAPFNEGADGAAEALTQPAPPDGDASTEPAALAPPPTPAQELGAEVKARAERQRPPPTLAPAPVATFAPPPSIIEIQTPPPERPRTLETRELDPERRREQLKERLKAVRENPRPEPLPATVAEAGVLVVERISTLQAELQHVKALNLALTQDLEAARRQSEKATEEARLRMDESRRLAAEMEGRVQLLSELERELAGLEAERDEAILALQEARQGLQAAAQEQAGLEAKIAEKERALADTLSEEERLCAELESSRDEVAGLRRAVDALTDERSTLARQVAELTAERSELLEARKALEAVHRALSQAVK